VHQLDARFDHVAVAVPGLEAAMAARWTEALGAVPIGGDDIGAFATRQRRFRGGGKLELLAPSALDDDPGNFVRRFLARFGAAAHHLTLKVDDLQPALRRVREGGFADVEPGAEAAVLRGPTLRHPDLTAAQ
jgi:catechol 2,3-dioxygenase-like lactoylglutathione lyase family enzyme